MCAVDDDAVDWSASMLAAMMAGECCESGCADTDEAGGDFGGSEGWGLVFSVSWGGGEKKGNERGNGRL